MLPIKHSLQRLMLSSHAYTPDKIVEVITKLSKTSLSALKIITLPHDLPLATIMDIVNLLKEGKHNLMCLNLFQSSVQCSEIQSLSFEIEKLMWIDRFLDDKENMTIMLSLVMQRANLLDAEVHTSGEPNILFYIIKNYPNHILMEGWQRQWMKRTRHRRSY